MVMRMILNERGGSRFKVYAFFVFLIIAVHVALKVVPMYMDYGKMQDEMTTKAGLAQILKDDEIVRDLAAKAKELDLPLTADSFILNRDTDRRRMSISTKGGWDVELKFFGGYYTRTFHFEPSVEENFMTISR
jgi:hypothetical protein